MSLLIQGSRSLGVSLAILFKLQSGEHTYSTCRFWSVYDVSRPIRPPHRIKVTSPRVQRGRGGGGYFFYHALLHPCLRPPCCVALQQISTYRYVAALPGKQIGFHGHHNQQLGMANSIDAITEGANMVDGSILGLGRGAGNTPTENVLCFLRNPKYNVRPIFEVVEKQFYELKKTVLRQPPPPASTLFSP